MSSASSDPKKFEFPPTDVIMRHGWWHHTRLIHSRTADMKVVALQSGLWWRRGLPQSPPLSRPMLSLILLPSWAALRVHRRRRRNRRISSWVRRAVVRGPRWSDSLWSIRRPSCWRLGWRGCGRRGWGSWWCPRRGPRWIPPRGVYSRAFALGRRCTPWWTRAGK